MNFSLVSSLDSVDIRKYSQTQKNIGLVTGTFPLSWDHQVQYRYVPDLSAMTRVGVAVNLSMQILRDLH